MGRTNATTRSAASFRAALRFAASPLIECCYALARVCDDAPDVSLHGGWTSAARRRLSPAFWRRLRATASWSRTWCVVPDLLEDFAPEWPVERLASRLRAVRPTDFAIRFLGSVLHPLPLVRRVVARELSLHAAVGKAPAVHREWLLFSGLYPFDPDSPVAQTLQQALDDPRRFGESVAALLEEFWSTVFRDTWQFARPQYARSAAEKARLQVACTPQQLADELRLRVEVNLRRGYLQAVRGGYRLPLSRLGSAWMIPSAFNVHHFWHVLESRHEDHALFPYFDPGIELGIVGPGERSARRAEEEGFDPALVFRALADSARYSMVLLLGATPRTATELGQALSLSKGTVSHHVHILREAGVVTRSLEGSATLLQLNRATLERLSVETLRAIDTGSAVGSRRTKRTGNARK